MMKIYGLTGMSGAGKSTVCDSFESAGFLIIDCDSVITNDGELDRRAMGNIVFSHSDKLALLNNTIYPYITYEVISMCGYTDKRFVLLDAPTLFESGIDFICDGIISVTCDKEKSIQRIMLRDNITRESAEKRLGSQHGAE